MPLWNIFWIRTQGIFQIVVSSFIVNIPLRMTHHAIFEAVFGENKFSRQYLSLIHGTDFIQGSNFELQKFF